MLVCVSPSARRRHSLSLSPRLTVTGRDPSNYLFLDHMQMAEQCGERRLAVAAAGLMRLATAHKLTIYHQNKRATSNRSSQRLAYKDISISSLNVPQINHIQICMTKHLYQLCKQKHYYEFIKPLFSVLVGYKSKCIL